MSWIAATKASATPANRATLAGGNRLRSSGRSMECCIGMPASCIGAAANPLQDFRELRAVAAAQDADPEDPARRPEQDQRSRDHEQRCADQLDQRWIRR